MTGSFKNGLIKIIVDLLRFFGIPKKLTLSVPPSGVLVVNTTGVGDTLWATPSLRCLKNSLPDAYIGMLTNRAGAEVLKGNPDVSEIFVFQKGFKGFFSVPKLLGSLRSRRFDIVFIFHASDRLIWPLCHFTGAPEVVAFPGQSKGLDFFATRFYAAPEGVHRAEARLGMLRSMGIKGLPGPLAIFLADEEQEEMRLFRKELVKDSSMLVGLHPGAQKPFKCWSAQNFIETGKRLTQRTGCRCVITGGPGEERLADAIASGIDGAVSVAGKLGLRQTAALIAGMNLFITNDTGPMHIAFAFKTPTIALFSPTDPRLCGPWHTEKAEVIEKPKVCNPCMEKKCYNPVCMGQITVEEVLVRAELLLRNNPGDDFHRGL